MPKFISILLLSLIAFLALGQVPPLPRTFRNASEKRGAEKLMEKVIIPPGATTNIVLSWSYDYPYYNPASNIVFLVKTSSIAWPYQGTTNWRTALTTTSLSVTQPINRMVKSLLFIVTASNTLTHLESLPATRK